MSDHLATKRICKRLLKCLKTSSVTGGSRWRQESAPFRISADFDLFTLSNHVGLFSEEISRGGEGLGEDCC